MNSIDIEFFEPNQVDIEFQVDIEIDIWRLSAFIQVVDYKIWYSDAGYRFL